MDRRSLDEASVAEAGITARPGFQYDAGAMGVLVTGRDQSYSCAFLLQDEPRFRAMVLPLVTTRGQALKLRVRADGSGQDGHAGRGRTHGGRQRRNRTTLGFKNRTIPPGMS